MSANSSYSELLASLSAFRRDSSKYWEDTLPLELFETNLEVASKTYGDGNPFFVAIPKENPLITKPSQSTFTVNNINSQSVPLYAKISCAWEISNIRTHGKTSQPADRFSYAGLMSNKCIFVANINGNERDVLTWHFDMQAKNAKKLKGPGIHLQMAEDRPLVATDIPRFLGIHIHLIDVLDQVLVEVFNSHWTNRVIRNGPDTGNWWPDQKRRLQEICSQYAAKSSQRGWLGIKEYCAHEAGLKL